MRVITLVLLVTAAVGLEACDLPGSVPKDVAVVVNGTNVPKSQYDRIVDGTVRSFQARGLPIDAGTTDGQARMSDIRTRAVKALVRDTIVQQIADAKHISVSDQELNDAVNQVTLATGGSQALKQRLDQAGQTEQDFRDQLRLQKLATKLRGDDPQFDQHRDDMIKAATVKAYVAPCDNDHNFPKCVGGSPLI